MGTDETNDERLTQGFIVGTIQGTIISAPINYSAYLMGFKYTMPIGSGTIGVATVLAQITTQRFGTVTGTVDVFNASAAVGNVRDSFSHPVGRLEAGDQLVGLITIPTGSNASILGVVEYRWIPGRLQGP
jgi:hypothetical protein